MKNIQNWLKERQVTEVECITSDHTGIARGKIMPTEKFIAEKGIRLPESVLLQTATGDYPDDELYYRLLDDCDIDMVLKPDEAAMFMVPWADEPSAQIIHDCYDKMGNEVGLSARTVLKKILALYEEKGWEPIVAPEVEFYLTQRCTDPDLPLNPPIGRSGLPESGRQSFSIDAANEFDPIIEDIYDWCEEMNLDIDTLIHEEGPAQLEFNFRHGNALKLADQVFVFKRTVREAALKHKIGATFMAKPIANEPGSAMHIHCSVIDKKGKNIFSNEDGSASSLFHSFVAGLQTYIPKSMPIFAPNVNSYRRYLPGADGNAPVNLEWGVENRTAALRVIPGSPSSQRLECRVAGADANPYLVAAAVGAAMLAGIEGDFDPMDPVVGNAYDVEDELPEGLRFPVGLRQAAERFAESGVARQYLGEEFVDHYAMTRIWECRERERHLDSWQLERYFEII